MFKTWPVSNVSPSAGLGDLRVHDLRHTVAMRLREASVSESTVSDVLWHSTRSMTHHYSVAQVVELHSALEQVKDDSGRWNTSLAMLKLEQKGQPAGASPAKVPQEGKTAYRAKLASRSNSRGKLARLAGFEPTIPWFVAGSKSNGVMQFNDLAAPSNRILHRRAGRHFRKSRKSRARQTCPSAIR